MTATITALNSRIRELEEALVRCQQRGIKLRDVLLHYDDVPRPANDAADADCRGVDDGYRGYP